MDEHKMIARRIARDRRDGYRARHRIGLCGGHADLCPECQEDETEMMTAEACTFARHTPPIEGETLTRYWRRRRGPFDDAWLDASHAAFLAAGIAPAGL